MKITQQFRSRLVHFLIFLSMFLVLLVLVQPVISMWHNNITRTKAQFISYLEKRFGHVVSYDSIEPGFLHVFELRGLSFHSRETGEELFSLERVQLVLDFWKLIDSNHSGGIEEVVVSDISLKLDVLKEQKGIQFVQEMIETLQTMEGKNPLANTTVRLRDLYINVINGENEIQIANLDGRIVFADDLIVFNLDCVSRLISGDSRFSSPVSVKGTSDTEFTTVESRILFDGLDSNLFSLSRQNLQLSYKNGKILVNKLENRDPVNLTVSVEENVIGLEFESEGFKPSSIAYLKGDLSRYNSYLNGVVSGTTRIRFDVGDFSYDYDSDLHLYSPVSPLGTDITVDWAFSGNHEKLLIDSFALDSRVLAASFAGDVDLKSFLPSGRLFVKKAAFPGLPVSAGRMTLQREPDNRLGVYSNAIYVQNKVIENLAVSMKLSADNIEADYHFAIDPLLDGFFIGDADLNLNDMSGRMNFAFSETSLVELYEWASLVAAIDIPGMKENVEDFSVEGGLHIGFSDDDFISRSSAILVKEIDNPDNYAELSFDTSSDSIDVSIIEGRWQNYTGSGSFSGIQKGNDLVFASGFEIQGTPFQLDGVFDNRGLLKVNGSYGINITADFQNSRKEFTFACQDFLPPVDGFPYKITTRVEGYYSDFFHWFISVGELVVSDDTLRFSSRANIGPERFVLYDSEFQQGDKLLSGFVKGDISDQGVQGNIVFENDREALQGRFTVDNNGLSITSSFLNLDLERTSLENLTGEIDGALRIVYVNDDDFDIQLQLNGSSIEWDKQEYNGTVSLLMTADKIIAFPLEIGGPSFKTKDAYAEYDIANDSFSGNLDFLVNMGTELQKLPIRFKMTLPEINHMFAISELASGGFSGTIELLPSELFQNTYFSFDVLKNDAGLFAAGGPGNSISLSYLEGGDFSAELFDPLPIKGKASGRISDNQIDLNVSSIQMDMNVLQPYLPADIVSLASGDVNGEFKIKGLISDPDFSGNIVIKNLSGRVAMFNDDIKSFDIGMRLLNKRIVFNTFILPVGSGKAELSGSLTIDHWTPSNFNLDIHIPGESSVSINQNFGSIALNGFINGDITVESKGKEFFIGGGVYASNAILTVPQASEETAGDLFPVTIDMDIGAGPNLEFLWPDQNFPIISATIRHGEGINLFVDILRGKFGLNGGVELQRGEIFLPQGQRNFFIRSGLIHFQEDENIFDPKVNIEAVSLETVEGESIKIILEVKDQNLSNFSPRFYTDPPVANDVLMALLNQVPEDINLQQVLGYTGDLITQFTIIKEVEKSVRNFLHLDLFSIRTPFLQNILGEGERYITAEGDEIDTLGTYLDNTSIFFGKQLGTDVFIELLLKLEADTIVNPETDLGLKIQSEIGMEFETPFFLLDWSFKPENADTLFLTDNTFSLYWRFNW